MSNKLVVVRGHVATIGYEDSNPFSLCNWLIGVYGTGYTHILTGEFDMTFLKEEDKAQIPEGDDIYSWNDPNVFTTNIYKETYDLQFLEEEFELEEVDKDRPIILIAPITPLVSLEDGDIDVTKTE